MFTGKVTRPDFETGDKKVKLTATVTKGNVTKDIAFDVIVKKLGITDGQSVIRDIAWLKVPAETKENLQLPKEGPNQTVITWVSETPAVLSNTGLVTRPAVGESDANVKITATVTKGEESQTKEFTVKVFAWTTTDEIENAKSLITWELIAGTNSSINMVTANLVLPAVIGRQVPIAWKTSNADFCDSDGTITRPTYTQGPVIISVTATLRKDGEETTKTIQGIRLEPAAITNGEIALDAVNKLDPSMFLGSNPSLSQITNNMILPHVVPDLLSDTCVFGWSIVDEEDNALTTPNIRLVVKANHTECVVTRPTSSDGNVVAFLKAVATATEGSAGTQGTANKRFRVIVLAQTDGGQEA